MNHIALPNAFLANLKLTLNDWESFVKIHHQPVLPTSIRYNPLKIVEEELVEFWGGNVLQEKIPWANTGYYLSSRPSFTLDPLFHAGGYYVQEASSMLLEQAVRQTVELDKPLIALDLCAAPGGKSTHLLSLLNEDSLLVSNEVIRSRVTTLSENVQKWGNLNVVVTSNDPNDFKKIPGFFDFIVIDAPCSGEGLFRKDEKAIAKWSAENVLLCSQRQRRILVDIWSSLKQNGILIYSTCTFNAQENEDVLKWLSKQYDIEFLKLQIDSSWGVTEVTKEEVIGYRCYPHRVKGEGFFISVIRKKTTQKPVEKLIKKSFQLASHKIKEKLSHWLKPHPIELILQDQLILCLPQKYLAEINLLSSTLRVIAKGTAIATEKHEQLVPEHRLALSSYLNRSHFSCIELSLEQALQYLRKESLTLTGYDKGFSLVSYKHIPIGWVKLVANRVNNLYPINQRILKK